MTRSFTVTFPFRPSSGKNNLRIFQRKAGPSFIGHKSSVATEKAALIAYIQQAVARQRWRILEDESVCLEIEHDADTDTVTARVSVLAPKPKGRTGRKRDLHNITDLIADAMQGIVFTNDNQVGRVVLARFVGGTNA